MYRYHNIYNVSAAESFTLNKLLYKQALDDTSSKVSAGKKPTLIDWSSNNNTLRTSMRLHATIYGVHKQTTDFKNIIFCVSAISAKILAETCFCHPGSDCFCCSGRNLDGRN